MPDIAKINAVAIADIEKVDGILAANIEKVNGLVFSTAPAIGAPAAAYSVRLLDTAVGVPTYTGAAMRVRRDTGGTGDDDEADIAFDTSLTDPAISLDSAISNTSAGVTATTLGQFLNVGTVNGTTYTNPDSLTVTASCLVDSWMDQSGNANDATQATQGSQPQIHDGTVNTDLITENGKPAVDFRSLQNLTLTSTNLITAFAVGRADTDNSQSENYIMSGTVLWGYNRTYAEDDSIAIQLGVTRVSVGLATDNNQKLGYVNNQSGTQYVAQDGGTASSGSLVSGAVTMIANRIPRTYYTLNGTVQEIMIWTSDESDSRTGIENDINDFFSIY